MRRGRGCQGCGRAASHWKFQIRKVCALRMETGLHLESVGGRTSWCFSCMSQADLSAAAAVASGCCARELLFPLLALAAKGQLQLFKSCGASVYTNPTEWCPRLGCDKTGGRMWFASAIFIDHLCSPVCSLLSPGTRVCELGAGCGSVGLALNFKLGCDVTLTPSLITNFSKPSARHEFPGPLERQRKRRGSSIEQPALLCGP